jgi:hypothetical protein
MWMDEQEGVGVMAREQTCGGCVPKTERITSIAAMCAFRRGVYGQGAVGVSRIDRARFYTVLLYQLLHK